MPVIAIDWINNGRLRRLAQTAGGIVMPVLIRARLLERIEASERPGGGDAEQKRQQADSEA
jgi:hypothetical protein